MGCAPSTLDVTNNGSSNNNNNRSVRVVKEEVIVNRAKKDEPHEEDIPLLRRRGSPLPPRISVTVAPDPALLDVVPTNPVENPTLWGYIYVPPPVPVVVYQSSEACAGCYHLTARGERLVFERVRQETDLEHQTQYVFDMYQYASQCADAGTTVALVHRQSGRCIGSSPADGAATIMDFPDWMSQDTEEIEINPRFFLRTPATEEADHTLFQCHSGPAKYLARDADTNKAYMSPWMRYPSFLRLKVVT